MNTSSANLVFGRDVGIVKYQVLGIPRVNMKAREGIGLGLGNSGGFTATTGERSRLPKRVREGGGCCRKIQWNACLCAS